MKNKPDISDINLEELLEKPGKTQVPYRVMIEKDAYTSIVNHLSGSLKFELGGVLVGDLYKDAIGPYLEITDIIEAKRTDSQHTYLVFTQETWSEINQTLASNYPEKKIVGWYHSHPGHGVFLSSQDVFLHESFFDLPWQTAFVIDPTSGDEAFFIWQNGKAVPLEFFWSGEKLHVRHRYFAPQHQTKNAEDRSHDLDNKKELKKNSGRRLIPVAITVVGLFFVSAFTVSMLYGRNSNAERRPEYFNKKTDSSFSIAKSPANDESFTESKADKEQLKNQILGLYLPVDCHIKETSIGVAVLCSGSVHSLSQKQKIDTDLRGIDEVRLVDLGDLRIIPYETKSGDSLSKIAYEIYGLSNKWRVIHAANMDKIADPNTLRKGIVLDIP